MKVICISGKARHGKDTVAEIAKTYLEENGQNVLVAHYADLVKYICKTFFGWDGEKDEYGRTLLQYVGTDVVRNQHPNYWVNFIAGILTMFNDWDYVIIPDTRFPNEISRLKDEALDVTHIRVVRNNFDNGLTNEQKSHSSETAMDNEPYDYLIDNSNGLEELKKQVVSVLNK